jgi:mycothiol synthase
MSARLNLPDGYAAEPAAVDDVEAVTALVADCEQHDLGEVLIEVEDLVGSWQRPSFDLAEQSALVRRGDRLAAYGEVSDARAQVYVHPDHRGRGLGTALALWTSEVARRQGSERVGQTVPDGLGDAVELFRGLGYQPLWTSWILELPPDARLDAVPAPEGVTIRPCTAGQEQAAYEVIENAFAEWPDRTPTTYADWAAEVLGRPGFEPWQLLVAVEADECVGACYLSTGSGVAFIHELAVRHDHRGRGLGRALLVRAFEEGHSHGATGGELSTDSRTGALGLYEHVGMRVRQSFTHFSRPL